MAVTYRPTDYLYLSARLRAREAALVGKDRLARLAELGSAEEALSALISEGVLNGDAKSDPEGALDALLREEYGTVRAAAPNPALFAFLLYPTDCHNLKSLLKCHYRGVSPDALLIDAGSIPTEELAGLFERVPDTVPAHMRAAVDEARVAFERTGDPREIDFLLDAACFADMSENAAALPGYLSLTRGYDEAAGAAASYPPLVIISTLAWGLGYFGMPHILLRFMAIKDSRKLSLSRRVATVWVFVASGF